MPEQAVADIAPASETPVPEPTPAETPISEVYERALKQAQGKTEETPEKPAKASKEEKPAPEAPKEEKAPTKPSSALEAALETTPEETKEEPAPDPLAEFPEDGKNKNWKGLRGVASKAITEANQLKAETARLAKELEAAKSTPPEEFTKIKSDYDRMKAEYDEMKDAMTAVNIELDPEFRKEFVDGRKELVNDAVAILKDYGGNVSALQRALALPEGKARDEAVEEAFGDEMLETGKSKVRQAIIDIEKLDRAKAKKIGDPQHSYEEYMKRRSAGEQKKAAEIEAERQSEISRTLKDLTDKSGFFRQVGDDLPDAKEWNADLAKLDKGVAHALGPQATLQEATTLAAKGLRYDFVAGLLSKTHSELVAAKRQLAEFDTAQPDAKGVTPPKKTEAEEKLTKTPGQIYRETMSALSGGDID